MLHQNHCEKETKIPNRKIEEFWNSFEEFSSNSTFHSVHYIGAKDNNRITRSFWFVCFTVCLIGCIYLTRQSYLRWKESPIIVTFDQNMTHISEINFPAVTFCYNEKFNKEIMNLDDVKNRYYDSNSNVTHEEISQLHSLHDICDNFEKSFGKLTNPKSELNSRDFIENLNKITTDYITDFKFDGKNLSGFRRIVTPNNGICFSFNLLEDKDMFTDQISDSFLSKYLNSKFQVEEPEKYPMRAFTTGYDSGLRMRLNITKETYSKNCSDMKGYLKVFLGSPQDYPQLSKHYIAVPFDSNARIVIKPQVLSTTENLRKIDINIRRCYFNDERKLKFFKQYTRPNCKLECESSFQLNECQCVSFSMLHNSTTKICQKYNERNCLASITLQKLKEARKKCNCLPSCNDFQYDYEVSTTFYEEDNTYDNLLVIYFASDSFMKMSRTEIFGYAEFLSSCGGFLGLLMGGSFLSLIEVFYYACLRNHLNKLSRLRKEKKETEFLLSSFAEYPI